MLHVLGMLHEHQRKDRDNYVNIQWNNIPYVHDRVFMKFPKWDGFFGFTLDLPYEGKSIMHYHSTQGSLDGSPVITSKVTFQIKKKSMNNFKNFHT